jgi:hypothetical protein
MVAKTTLHPRVSPKVAGLSTLLLVFVCGMVAGGVVMNLGAHNMLHHRPFWDNSARSEYLKDVAAQLDLTPEQSVQMQSILDDFAKYYQTVLSDGKARILSILNDEQKRKFERITKERPRG